jgi:hypothetical protein
VAPVVVIACLASMWPSSNRSTLPRKKKTNKKNPCGLNPPGEGRREAKRPKVPPHCGQ